MVVHAVVARLIELALAAPDKSAGTRIYRSKLPRALDFVTQTDRQTDSATT